jgi:hypothetical protein
MEPNMINSPTLPGAATDTRKRGPKKSAAWFYPMVKLGEVESAAMAIVLIPSWPGFHACKTVNLSDCLRDDFGNILADHIGIGDKSANCCAAIKPDDGGKASVWAALMGFRSRDAALARSLGAAKCASMAGPAAQIDVGGFLNIAPGH